MRTAFHTGVAEELDGVRLLPAADTCELVRDTPSFSKEPGR